MGNSQITYNSKTLTFTAPNAYPTRFRVNSSTPSNKNLTLTGIHEILTLPRVDTSVNADFDRMESATLRLGLEEWWSWAQFGNPFTFSIDSSHTVNTTTAGSLSPGGLTITVASATGIIAGQRYFLRSGPYYQIVQATTVIGTTVTISSAINFPFDSGCVFRHRYHWPGVIREEGQESPIEDIHDEGADARSTERFSLRLRFMEDLS